MRNHIRILAALIFAAGIVYLASMSSRERTFAVDEPQADKGTLLLRELTDKDKATREKALISIRMERIQFVAALSNKLKEYPAEADTSFHCPLHVIILTAGELRIAEVAPLLLKMIDYHIDERTVPVGDKYPREAFFPAAEALVKISSTDITPLALRRLEREESEEKAKILVWVLLKIHGEDTTRCLIRNAREKTTVAPLKAQLDKAEAFLIEARTTSLLPQPIR